jgi:hypothetical protein
MSKFPYVYNSIVTGEKIHYGSMKIKHQKRLIELTENIENPNSSDNEITFIEMVKRMMMELIDTDNKDLFYVDFEYLMFLIRGKTYGDQIEYIKSLGSKDYNFVFDIGQDFTIEGEKGLSKLDVDLTTGEVVEISPVRLSEFDNMITIKNVDLLNYSILTYSLRKRKNEDEVEEFRDYKSKADFINDLEIEDLKSLKKAYNRFPKIKGKKVDSIEGFEVTTEFGDLMSNFFVYV